MKPIVTLIILLAAFRMNAQINAYAKVTSIATTNINVASPNETYGSFTAGSQVIIMQMQDNVIGSNTSNASTFGDLSTIASTGMYEMAIISSVVKSAGVVTQIKITSPLSNTYNFNTNSHVQVVSFPLLGSGGYSTVSDITALAWDGTVGGIVAFRVSGTLTLNHNIYADGKGFRGAVLNAGNAGSCDAVTYFTAANELNGNKGEGIYKVTNSNYAAGRAKILNGGGGGNSHNGGGGGGSHVSAGGEGGKGYSCSSNAGGLGGVSLNTYVTANRVFMGGGGGAGEGNNSFNTAGGNGGGLVIINATQIITTGSGAALRISSNGQTAADVGNDGAGGGGAAGSVLLNVQSWNIAASRNITITANGGNGGNVADPTAHGGGGGGGQGAIIYSTAIPTSNITSNTLNGSGGRNYSGGTFAENAIGSSNVGIFSNSSFSVLAAKPVTFNALSKDSKVLLEWKSIEDIQLNRYEVQRSEDGINYKTIANVNALETPGPHNYSYIDDRAVGNMTYYRLKMVDNTGRSELSDVVMFKSKIESELKVSLAPNPARESGILNVTSKEVAIGYLRIIDNNGRVVFIRSFCLSKGENKIALNNLNGLNPGSYQVSVIVNNVSAALKMMIQ